MTRDNFIFVNIDKQINHTHAEQTGQVKFLITTNYNKNCYSFNKLLINKSIKYRRSSKYP